MMNSTRIVLLLGCFLGLAPIASAEDPLLRRDGRYLSLTTDLQSVEEVEGLVESFDAAVPQWLRFWGLSDSQLTDFKVEACVIRDKQRFTREGLIPPHIPDFPFGYADGNRIWVLAQGSEYYTRHLVLHEGVHAFCFAVFGGAGPTWFQEGTAELLATHRGSGLDVITNQIPQHRDDVPFWGRFKLMGQLRNDGEIPSLFEVMRYKPNLKGDVASYAWSWSATMILDAYPEYRDAFQAAARKGRNAGPGFNRRLRQDLRDQLPILLARWRIMCDDIDYGFDWSREQVELSTKDPIWNGQKITFKVAADRGWQSIGLRIPRGAKVRLSASGKVVLANTTKPWVSEPAGITYQYHRGRPLGQLLACVLPNAVDIEQSTIAPLDVEAVTPSTVLAVADYSWLLFRVNDAVDSLGDNQGEYEVVISR